MNQTFAREGSTAVFGELQPDEVRSPNGHLLLVIRLLHGNSSLLHDPPDRRAVLVHGWARSDIDMITRAAAGAARWYLI